MRLDGNTQLLPTDLGSSPGGLLEISRVKPRFFDQRIKVKEERLVFAELRKVYGNDVIAGRRVLRVEQDLLMQDVEWPDLELDLAAGRLLHVVMAFLHDLEHRVADG